MAHIQAESSLTGAQEIVKSANNRLLVDSRFEFEDDTYSLPFLHSAAADGQYSVYLINNSISKVLVVDSIVVNASTVSLLKLWAVTGTGANGVARTPRNLNLDSPSVADATALHDGGGTAISGLTVSGAELGEISLLADDNGEFNASGLIRFGLGKAIAVELETGDTTPLITGNIIFHFE